VSSKRKGRWGGLFDGEPNYTDDPKYTVDSNGNLISREEQSQKRPGAPKAWSNRRSSERSQIERLHAKLFAALVGQTQAGRLQGLWRKVTPEEGPRKCLEKMLADTAGKAAPSHCWEDIPVGGLIEMWHEDHTDYQIDPLTLTFVGGKWAGEKVNLGDNWPECVPCSAKARVQRLFDDMESVFPDPCSSSIFDSVLAGYTDVEDLHSHHQETHEKVKRRVDGEWEFSLPPNESLVCAHTGERAPPGPDILEVCEFIFLNETLEEAVERCVTAPTSPQEDYKMEHIERWVKGCVEMEELWAQSLLLGLWDWTRAEAYLYTIIVEGFHPHSRVVDFLRRVSQSPAKVSGSAGLSATGPGSSLVGTVVTHACTAAKAQHLNPELQKQHDECPTCKELRAAKPPNEVLSDRL
jgi:hypothetical protein